MVLVSLRVLAVHLAKRGMRAQLATESLLTGLLYIDLHRHPGAPMNLALEPGKAFVMGDNRDRSFDSRFWGFVKLDQIEGHVKFIYWSWSADNQSLLAIRWSRVGKAVE
jgi:type IV secretory pathway protease TraF